VISLKVKDLMTKEVISVNRTTAIKKVVRIFSESAFGSLPVVGEEKKIVGIITKKDLLMTFLPEYFDLLEDVSFIEDFGLLEESLSLLEEGLLLVDDVMSKKVVTIKEDESLFKAVALMIQSDVRRLPVVDEENKLVGIITQTHVCQAILRKGK
jgi:predicted transcriptional regulator